MSKLTVQQSRDGNPRPPVAAGRISLYYHRFIYPWDIAPGLLLVQEAGGKVTDWQGHPATLHSTQIIASINKLHSNFTKYFNQTTNMQLKQISHG